MQSIMYLTASCTSPRSFIKSQEGFSYDLKKPFLSRGQKGRLCRGTTFVMTLPLWDPATSQRSGNVDHSGKTYETIVLSVLRFKSYLLRNVSRDTLQPTGISLCRAFTHTPLSHYLYLRVFIALPIPTIINTIRVFVKKKLSRPVDLADQINAHEIRSAEMIFLLICRNRTFYCFRIPEMHICIALL